MSLYFRTLTVTINEKNVSERIYDEKCLSKNLDKKNSQSICLNKFNIKKIISYPNYLMNKKGYNCELDKTLITSRNPFNKKIIEIEICSLRTN